MSTRKKKKLWVVDGKQLSFFAVPHIPDEIVLSCTEMKLYFGLLKKAGRDGRQYVTLDNEYIMQNMHIGRNDIKAARESLERYKLITVARDGRKFFFDLTPTCAQCA
jgi:hypothetical protein